MNKNLDRKTKAVLAYGIIPAAEIKKLQDEGILSSADTINSLSAYTINRLSADTINSLSAYTINRLSADTINRLSADTINSLSADTINRLSADTINSLSADTINSLSADTINSLSAYTINRLSADTINSLSEEKLKAYNEFWNGIPLLEKPYTRLLEDIQAKRRVHNQADFGPETCPAEENICGTAMCTAGHLVNMAGSVGYELKNKYGWAEAAFFIHRKAHPDYPCQNFGSIPQDWAIAYIEEMAEREKNEENAG